MIDLLLKKSVLIIFLSFLSFVFGVGLFIVLYIIFDTFKVSI